MADQDGPDVAALVAEAVAGRQPAWDAIVRRYAPLVLAVARHCGLTGHDAKDVAQTVWLRLVEHLDQLREPRALGGWLRVTTRHECLRYVQRARRAEPVDALEVGLLADETQHANERESVLLAARRHTALLEAFAELSDVQRELLTLLTTDPRCPPLRAETSSPRGRTR